MHTQAIEGKIQTYAWGGYDFLAELTKSEKQNAREPWAELWLGAHPKGPARLIDTDLGLDEAIAADPFATLGAGAENWGNRLPYLLKVLDVRQMLSIQTHPTKAGAEAGFAREEENGPERTAPTRNYRDDNHKPELGLALTDFYLLHGFKSAEQIRRTLLEIPGWRVLLPKLDANGVPGLYHYVMEAEQAKVNALLEPLARVIHDQDYRSSKAEFWAQKAFLQYTRDGNYDRGIFSIFWFNLVHLRPGEAIFQDAGIPHAYLEGVCIEIMANSDNVLRGGLTVKHIDVPELMKHLCFDPVTPQIIQSEEAGKWETFPVPVADFELSRRSFTFGEAWEEADSQACIYLVLAGKIRLGDRIITSGQAIFQPACDELNAEILTNETTVFRAR